MERHQTFPVGGPIPFGQYQNTVILLSQNQGSCLLWQDEGTLCYQLIPTKTRASDPHA